MAVGGGETQKDPSGWTVDTLHAHYDQRLRDLELRLEQRFMAQQAALAEKDATTQARLANINEFRAQLGDVLAESLPRKEAEQRFDSIGARLGVLERRHADDLAQVNSRLDVSTGRGLGVEKVWAFIVAAVIAVGGAVATAIAVFSK